jgi:hypothetical protein
LVVDLRSVSAELLGERWKSLIAEWTVRFEVPGDRGGKAPP